MDHFRSYRIQDSIEDFDRAIELDSFLKPYLWQRGLSLYYAEKYQEGASQFQLDVSVNPNDTEESIWNFACQSKMIGFDEARKQLLKVDKDPRLYMRMAYRLFEGSSERKDLALIGKIDLRSEFYANFYLGLYSECKNEPDLARQYMMLATASRYCASNDYMCSVAKVHEKVRNWI